MIFFLKLNYYLARKKSVLINIDTPEYAYLFVHIHTNKINAQPFTINTFYGYYSLKRLNQAGLIEFL